MQNIRWSFVVVVTFAVILQAISMDEGGLKPHTATFRRNTGNYADDDNDVDLAAASNKTYEILEKLYLKHRRHVRKCTSQDFRYGQWIKGIQHSPCGLVGKYKHDLLNHHHPSFGFHSTRIGGFRFHDMIFPWSNWCWQPSSLCSAESFSIYTFCEKLQNRSILIVGDSLSHEFYLAVAGQLGMPLTDLQMQTDKPFLTGNSSLICQDTHPGSKSRLSFLRNDAINVVNHPSHKDRLQPYDAPEQLLRFRDWKVAALSFFDIVVLCKGAHQEIPWESQVFYTDTTAHFLKDFLYYKDQPNSTVHDMSEQFFVNTKVNNLTYEELKEFKKLHRRRVFFRTVASGHPRASLLFAPVNETCIFPGESPVSVFPDIVPPLTESEIKIYMEQFHWDRFRVSNYYTRKVFQNMLPPPPFFDIIHGEEMSSLRPDSHVCTLEGKLNDSQLEQLKNLQEKYQGKVLPVDVLYNLTFSWVKNRILNEKCDKLHHLLPSDFDNYLYILHNLLE